MRFVLGLALLALTALSGTATAQTLYYCDTWHAYYPGVLNCPVPWRAVNPATVPRQPQMAPSPSTVAQPSSPTAAPSFSPRGDGLDEWCKTVRLPSSIAICSEPELRLLILDRQRAYDEARAKLTPDQQKALLADQNGWVKSYPASCGLAADVLPPLPLTPAIKDCMAQAGRARIAYLRAYAEAPVAANATLPTQASAPTAVAARAAASPATLPGATSTVHPATCPDGFHEVGSGCLRDYDANSRATAVAPPEGLVQCPPSRADERIQTLDGIYYCNPLTPSEKAAEDQRNKDERAKRESEDDTESGKRAIFDAMTFDPNLKLSFGFFGSMDLTLSSLNAATASALATKLCGTYHHSGGLRVYLVNGQLAAQCDFHGRAASSPQCDEEMKAVVASMRDMATHSASPAQIEAYATTHTSQKCKDEAESR